MTVRGPARRGVLTAAAGVTAVAVTAPGARAAQPDGGPGDRGPAGSWVTSWATAQTAPTATDTVASAGLTDGVFTATVRLSAGGRVRLRYGHAFGTMPVLVGPVTAGGRPVTFGGRRQAWLAAGASLTSDPVDGLRATDGSALTVETRLPGPTGPLSFHRNTHASHSVDGVRTTSVFLLTGVEVTGAHGPVVAVLGDSISEGVGTPDDADLRWPDQLARRLPGSAVADLGVSGNRLLLDDARFGPGGQSRFDRDVLALPGLRTVLVQLGVNDLQQPPAQTDPSLVLDGFRQLVLRARGAGLRIVGSTVTPFEGWTRWTPELDEVRQRINRAVRTGRLFDAVADFDAALRDPARPSRMRPAFDSGDGLHPNPSGHAALAGAVDRRHLL
ncbi:MULTISPECIES: GDSL-type esterase/lipase family protein [Streptomyces]|uniref:GDSL-type esterase/lipase family protein n=1 Tax=Streptomyces glycanivorans TaxID=3033808 RepID=A0ABY9JL71_9ACTN|nr:MULTISPECIES: GDSL-type esterase/lipase family protein [unclassified Streptomyces]WSQ81807.1 GDSL-type esterase/lipase family protein [Streptomyces sp. NBC_01213]TXS15883.1 SGNH/GDSL hydrolase family protein [Streptomyces sp. wa22]WLQ68448.1 GDSL-type esterase/lipase family protein [Streptomyces sp. Alt3]WSR04861.1 GDSL-type esterase/lipase family protein [Streptomyces sp. NBC_01208]WSR52528.1 GDSL-type esterase/lipase family protein [Streptomyces sp. NBC_01201]